MKFIKPEIEFVKYESMDIIATSTTTSNIIDLSGEKVFIDGNAIDALEKQFNKASTSNVAFVDINNFSVGMNINLGYYYLVNYVEAIDDMKNTARGDRSWPAYRVTLENLSGSYTVKGTTYEDTDGAKQFVQWLNNYMQ